MMLFAERQNTRMKIIIMAGGKGTRIASVNASVPKPMLPILGKPVLEYGIINIKEQGYTDIIMIVGHLGHIIKDYFGDGSRWGVSIQYIMEDIPLGSAGALYYMRQMDEDFLLINGDIIFDIDINRMYLYHKKHGKLVTIFVHPNDHPYDSSVIETAEDGCVRNWYYKESINGWYQNQVNAGIHLFSSRLFDEKWGLFATLKKMNLDRDVLNILIPFHEVYAYSSPEYVKDMGTPERLRIVTADIQSGRVKAKNLINKQRAVFLDRDGTINRYMGFLKNIEDFELLPGVGEAVREINRLGYLAVVVTNQPVIARGEVSEQQLQMIHNKMETLLGQAGAYVDAVYYCPHHPDRGYEGERSELKFDCSCRKPKPGLLLKAAEDFNTDLKCSWMVGDGERDIKAGRAVGCKTVFLGEETEVYGQDYTADSLVYFTKEILKSCSL